MREEDDVRTLSVEISQGLARDLIQTSRRTGLDMSELVSYALKMFVQKRAANDAE